MADLNHNIAVRATPAQVFESIATTEGNKGWWTADSEVPDAEGGKAQFGFDNRAAVFTMVIDKRSPAKELIMSCIGGPDEWVGTKLRWRLDEGDGETILHFTHEGWRKQTDFCASCNSMWGNLMFRLKAYAESGRSAPQWTE